MLKLYSRKPVAYIFNDALKINRLAYNHSYEKIQSPLLGKSFLAKGDDFEVYFDKNGIMKFAAYQKIKTKHVFSLPSRDEVIKIKGRFLLDGQSLFTQYVWVNNELHSKSFILYEGKIKKEHVIFSLKAGKWKKEKESTHGNVTATWYSMLRKRFMS
jgi:hypothetical protein